MSRFDLVREAVSAVRQIRSDYAIAPGRLMDTIIQSRVNGELFMEHSAMIGRLSRSAVKVGIHSVEGGAAHSLLADGTEIIIPLGGLVDLSKECSKLRTELQQLEVQLSALSKRLQNEGFTSRAPATVVANERNKEEEWTKRREQLAEKVKALCGG
jgi:valyl-tRNA synthetase